MVSKTTRQVCALVKPNGQPCGARPLDGSQWCWFHDPDRALERTAGRRAGGVNRSRKAAVLPIDTPDTPLRNAQDVIELLGATINHVRRGQLDPKIANSVGYLGSVALKAIEQTMLGSCISALESILNRRAMGAESSFDPGIEEPLFEFEKQAPEGAR